MSSVKFNLKYLKHFYFLAVIFGALPSLNFKTLKLTNKKIRITYSLLLITFYTVLYFISVWKRFYDVYPFTPNITDTILDFLSYTSMTITSIILITNNCLMYHEKIQKLFNQFYQIDELTYKYKKLLKSNLKNNQQTKSTKTKYKQARRTEYNYPTTHKDNILVFNQQYCFKKPQNNWFYSHIIVLFSILLFNLFYTEIFWTVTITFESNWGYTACNLLKIQIFIMSMMIYNLLLGLKHRFLWVNQNLATINASSDFMVLNKDIYLVINNSGDDMLLKQINQLNLIHKQLLLMCVDFNQLFGNPILALSVTFIVSILHPINSALCQVMKGNVIEGVDIPNFGLHYVIMSGLSAFNSMVLIVPLAHASYTVVKESRLAIGYSESLANNLSVFEYNDDVQGIISHLRWIACESCGKYPIFTANSFYLVDHSMLLTLFGSVSTYLIVLIQLNMIGEAVVPNNYTFVDNITSF